MMTTITTLDRQTDERTDGRTDLPTDNQWRNILTGGPWTNYIKGPIPHFEFTEELIIINSIQ